MGFLRKTIKKIGKGIKKIGKGLKKVMGKIMKPFAKLGIVGQIGLGMLMPWAIGGIFSGLTSSTFANFAGNLVSNGNLFGKMAGRLMQGVHWGATKIKGAYSSVTEAISNGFETVTNKAKEMFGINADASNILTQDKTTVSPVTEEVIKEEVVDKTFGEELLTKTKDAVLDIPSKLVDTTINQPIEPEIPFNNQVADFLSLDARSAYTKYNEIDFTQLNNYNNELISQGGLYAGPAHTVQVGVDNSFGMNDFDAFLQGGR
tara:strand:+ start:2188 stop:2967 length:780 start_codon:yes stop_codon:yes gene_type:complete